MSLYIVATPIGNLQDITLRALEVLKEVDYILSESPLTTLRLLSRYQIKTPLKRLPPRLSASKLEDILLDLKRGKEIAVVSRAGTPLLSDPGRDLVRKAWEEGIKVVPIAGISSLTTILSVCPLPSHHFVFLGFLPKKKKERERLWSLLAEIPFAVVFYESPHRLEKTLEELSHLFPNRRVFIGREMTKVYESFYLFRLSEWEKIRESVKIKGEFTVVLEGK